MIRYSLLLLSCFLCSCNNPRDLSSDHRLSLSVSFQTAKLSQASFTISNLSLENAQGEWIYLDQPPQKIFWSTGMPKLQPLFSNKIPLEDYQSLSFDVTIHEGAFQFAEEKLRGPIELLDSLNRWVPYEVNTFPVVIKFPHDLDSLGADQSLVIHFDGDKSIQPLYREESLAALFKPYFLLEALTEKNMAFVAMLDNMNDQGITLMTEFEGGRLHYSWDVIDALSLDGQRLQREDILENALVNDDLLAWVVEKADNLTSIRFFSKRSAINVYSGHLRGSYEGVFIDGKLVTAESQEEEIKLHSDVYFYDEGGTGLSLELDDLLSGQAITGSMDENQGHLTLLQSRLIAQVVSMSPMMIKPLSYNNFLQPASILLALDYQDDLTYSTGQLLSLSGVALGSTFRADSVEAIASDAVAFSLVLPSSLTDSPIESLLHGHLIALQPKRYEDAKIELTIAGSLVQLEGQVDYVDVSQANIRLYNDRITEANRVESFSSFKEAEESLKRLLLDAHHINEIHAKGQLKDSVLLADTIDMVIYGSSILDVIETGSLEEEINSAKNVTKNKAKENNSSNQTVVILGSTLAVGTVLAAGGLYLFFRESRGRKPLKSWTDEELAIVNDNLKPLYSTDIKKKKNVKGTVSPANDLSNSAKRTLDASKAPVTATIKRESAAQFTDRPKEMTPHKMVNGEQIVRFKDQDFYVERYTADKKRYYVYLHYVSTAEGELFSEGTHDYLTSLDNPLRQIVSTFYPPDQAALDHVPSDKVFDKRPIGIETILTSSTDQRVVQFKQHFYQELYNNKGQLIYQRVKPILLKDRSLGYLPTKEHYLTVKEVESYIASQQAKSKIKPTTIEAEVPKPTKPSTKQKRINHGFEMTSRPPGMIVHKQSTALGSIYKYQNKLYTEEASTKGSLLYREVRETVLDGNLNDLFYSHVDDQVQLDFDRQVNLDSWYRKAYPDAFSTIAGEIALNDQPIGLLINNKEMIDMQTALNFLDQYNKANSGKLFMKTTVASNGVVDISHADNAIIKMDNYAKQVNVAVTAQMEAELMQTRAKFVNDFLASNKQYAILPALPGAHFNAVIFVKQIVANQKKIIPIIVEPGSGLSRNSTKSVTQQVVELLPDNETLGKQLNLRTEARRVAADIQADGCSCGPVAVVAATKIVEQIEEKQIKPEALTEVKVEGIVNEIKGQTIFAKEAGHPRIRDYMLHVLDKFKKLKRSPTFKPVR